MGNISLNIVHDCNKAFDLCKQGKREIPQIRKTNFFSKVLDFYCARNAPFDNEASNLYSGFAPPRQPPPMIAQKTKPVKQNK